VTGSRAHPRFALEIETEIRRGPSAKPLPARTRDVSRGGLCLTASEPLPLGSEVDLQMALVFDEDTVSEPLLVRARVVWCTRLADKHQIGASFVALTTEQRNYLEMFLRYLAEGKRQEREREQANQGPTDDDPFS
jgi:hypothetical protein